MFSSHGSLLTIAMNTLINLTHYDETKKRAHDSQIVRAKENLTMAQLHVSIRHQATDKSFTSEPS